jgi:antibiotic biosynthesis monooxygenase (ABM) superfamily enzyme
MVAARALPVMAGLNARTPAADGRTTESPSRLRLTILIWAAVYPLLTALLFLAGPLLEGLPLPLRTLPATLVLVPTLTYVILPLAHRHLHDWLRGSRRPR